MVLGLSGEKVPINTNKLVNKGLILRGCVRSRSEHYKMAIELLRNDDFREKVKRTISKREFIIRSARDLEEAFRFADTEEGEARIRPGRVLVYFP